MRIGRLLRCATQKTESRLRVGMPVSAFAKPSDIAKTMLSSDGELETDTERLEKLTSSQSYDPSHPTCTGRITDQISDNVFVVAFDLDDSKTGRFIEVGNRVIRVKPAEKTGGEKDSTAGGGEGPSSSLEVKAVVTKLHGNGLVAIIEDDTGKFDNAVPRSELKPLRSSATLDSNDALLAMTQWIHETGRVPRRIDAYSAACALYRRGWRMQDIHLVEASDIHALLFLPRSARMTLIEAAERKRDLVRIKRETNKEAMMEQDWSYWLSKYSRVWGPLAGGVSVLTAFLWNYKNYQRSMRPAQVDIAAACWAHVPPNPPRVERKAMESRIEAILRNVDDHIPRVIVVTGNIGVGKTLLINAAAHACQLPTLVVELRGAAKEDPYQAVVKALGVPNLSVCGDLPSFLEDVAKAVRARSGGKKPLLVLKLKEDDIEKVYRDAVTLCAERLVCNVVLEVASERAKLSLLRSSRIAFVHVQDFSREEAIEFVDHRVDPVALNDFFDVIGTNASDLDNMIAATVHRGLDPFDAIAKRLQRAIADIRTQKKDVREGLHDLCQSSYRTGVPWVSDAVAMSPLVHLDTERKMYTFRSRAHYEAARIVHHLDADVTPSSASLSYA